MTTADIVQTLQAKLDAPHGRHLYGVLGTYKQLDAFATAAVNARLPDGQRFPTPLNVNREILDGIPDEEFRELVAHEAKRPEPTAAHVAQAFERFLRCTLAGKGLVVLGHLELVFAYSVELNLLRTLAADDNRVLLLLPGRRESGHVRLFPDLTDGSYALPVNLIADNHLWQLTE